MIASSYIDEPTAGEVVQRHRIMVTGWIHAVNDVPIGEVVVTVGEKTIGCTKVLFPRADVNAFLGLDPARPTGFVVSCTVPNDLRTAEGIHITVTARERSGEATVIREMRLVFSAYDYRQSGHGYQLEETFATVIPRASLYATGPPAAEASPEVVDLIVRYLEPGTTVLDVGCGIGAFGRAFRERGLPWVGCEIRPEFVDAACADGLEARLVENGRIPFNDATFDAAFAVEVLEHIDDPHPFLREMLRVAPRAGYFSVPNFEAIPVTSAYYALPWHMLEPDHWNFYARGSLKATLQKYYRDVEVFEYGKLPLLRALDGLPVYNHLFAVGRNG